MKILEILIIFFCLFLISYNLKEITVVSNDQYYAYLQNPKITTLYHLAIFIDIIFILFLSLFFIDLRKEKYQRCKVISKLLFITSIVFVGNVFLELYLGSTFYYGEVRDKQVLPVLVNNFGFVGCCVILSFSLFNFVRLNNKLKNASKRFLYFVILIMIVTIFLGFYFILREPWKM